MKIPIKYRLLFMNCDIVRCEEKAVTIKMVRGLPNGFCHRHSVLGVEPKPGEVR